MKGERQDGGISGRRGRRRFESRAPAREMLYRREGVRARRLQRLAAMGSQMDNRVCVGLAAKPAAGVEARVEAGGGLAVLAIAEMQIVQERVHARLGDVGIGVQVVGRVEFRDRTERAEATFEIMRERPLGGIGRAIPVDVEQRRGVAAGGLTDEGIVQQRASLRRSGVLAHVPFGIEHDVGTQRGAGPEIMGERVVGGREPRRVRDRIPSSNKSASRRRA